ncbi:hypothetical protein B0H16DRAFT_1695761 [Mycena metata]|uniref:DUF7779 domain-containing protein n=1 Tax=Mycena metata TaxID=1033252 RepID=A0AAD7I4F8_9AGAR|nr:hypothetical protein B0H16DRAFT_1695761 [Mycena metata]
MSPVFLPNSEPLRPQQPTGKKKTSSKSESEWLAPAILTARTITAAAESTPFLYIKGVSGTVLILLETVQNVKRNRKDLKDLCNTTTEIVALLHNQIVTYGNTAAAKFKILCEELESHLKAVIIAVQNLHNPSKGFQKRVKEFMGSSNITEEIAEYQNQIQGVYFKLKASITQTLPKTSLLIVSQLLAAVDTNSKVKDMHAIIMAPGFVVTPPNQSINNCPPPSRMFQGRQAILTKMHQFFAVNPGKQRIYVLHGLGGAGKTQIALKFIQESLARPVAKFSNMFLVDASTLDTLNSGLKNMAISKGVGNTAQDALTWLQSNHGEWLLFFDNADNPGVNLNMFFPQCAHGNIIITSRNPGLRVYGQHSLVSDIEKADAIALLLQSAAKESYEENVETAAKIVKELCYLPLAITQARSFISQSEDLEGYLKLYKKNQAQLLNTKPEQAHDRYAWTVYTTWQISFKKLSQPATILLQLCSFLHYTGISEDIFSNASKYSSPVWLPAKEELQRPLEFLSHFLGPTGEWDSLRFQNVTKEIRAYSLISFDATTKMLSIHPLVHTWMRSTLGDEVACHSCISALVGMSIADILDSDITLASLKLITHLEALHPFSATVEVDFRAAFWGIYLGAGKFKEAQILIQATFEKYKFIFGERHPATLEVMHRFAVTCRNLGEYKKAEKLQVEVVNEQAQLLGDDNVNTLKAMGNLAATYFVMGDFVKARSLGVPVLEKRTTLLGPDHRDTLMTMGNLALTHFNLGDYEKAKELETLVLQKQTTLLGQDHPDTLMTMGNLALTHYNLGDYEKAKELEVAVLQRRTEVLGEEHPYTLMAMGNLALTHFILGDCEKAKELEMMVLQKWTKVLGEEHPNTLHAMGNLAKTHFNLGNLEEAKELEMVVLDKQSTLLGQDHPDTLLAMWNLAMTHHKLGDFEAAKELGTVVLQKRTTLLGEDHPDTFMTMGNLALAHFNLGDYEKAKELEMRVLQKCTKVWGEEHPDTLLAMGNLAVAHSNLGDFEKTKELEMVVLEKRTTLLGQDHPDTLITMGNLAFTHSNLGDFEKAKELEIMVLEKRRELFGDGHLLSILAMRNLAHTYQKLQKQKEAEELEQLVKESGFKSQLTGDFSAQIASSLHNRFIFKSHHIDFVEQVKQRQLKKTGINIWPCPSRWFYGFRAMGSCPVPSHILNTWRRDGSGTSAVLYHRKRPATGQHNFEDFTLDFSAMVSMYFSFNSFLPTQSGRNCDSGNTDQELLSTRAGCPVARPVPQEPLEVLDNVQPYQR